MIKFLPLADLDAVALDRRLVARVQWPDGDVAEGRGAIDAAKVAAALFVPAGVPVPEAGGLLEVKAGTAEVRYEPVSDYGLVTVYTGAVVTPEEGERRFTTDLSQSRVVFGHPNSRLIELSWSPDQQVVVNELTLAEPATLRLAPPSLGVLDGNPDQWLCELVREHWAIGDNWHLVVAAGLALTNTTAAGRSWKEFTVESSWPHAWFSQTTVDQRRELAGRAVIAVALLREGLDDLDKDFDPGDGDWRAALLDWCRRRDDLEGVVILLDWMRQGAEVHGVLDPLDNAAAEFVRAIPIVFEVDDEQLRRAGRFNPEAWWALESR